MPFKGTPGPPDMRKAIRERDPKHVTRKHGRQNKKEFHCNTKLEQQTQKFGLLKHTWQDPIHCSLNKLYLLPKSMAGPTNVCIRKANDPSIIWKYEEDGPRQSARAYVSARKDTDVLCTRYVRLAYRGNKIANARFIHPELADSIIKGTPNTLSGDIVARWNQAIRRKARSEEKRMHATLRDGQPICVYFAH